jgi:hypothetical protein
VKCGRFKSLCQARSNRIPGISGHEPDGKSRQEAQSSFIAQAKADLHLDVISKQRKQVLLVFQIASVCVACGRYHVSAMLFQIFIDVPHEGAAQYGYLDRMSWDSKT